MTEKLEQGWFVGWKEISNYLGVSVRTAKKYYYEFSMPVRKSPTDNPMINPDEVDTWLRHYDEMSKLFNKKKRLKIKNQMDECQRIRLANLTNN